MKNEDLNLSHRLNLPATMDSFGQFVAFVQQTCENLGLDASLTLKLGLVLEELLINVVHYAYEDAGEPGDIEVRCGMAGPETFCLVIRDRGKPFNPLLAKTPDLSENVEDRPIGGLGIFLVREIADRLEYHRDDGTNTLVFCKNITPEARG